MQYDSILQEHVQVMQSRDDELLYCGIMKQELVAVKRNRYPIVVMLGCRYERVIDRVACQRLPALHLRCRREGATWQRGG